MGIVRQTKSLKAVLQVFDETESAISSPQLIALFQDHMNKTTVYRILERLVDEGLLHTFKGNEGISMYAKCKNCSSHQHLDLHPHFQCSSCGKTQCIEEEISIPILPRHQIDSVQFLLLGVCEDCL